MSPADDLPIVAEAQWLRDGQPALRIRLLSSPAYFGAGDFEDAADIAEDQPGQSYLLSYDSVERPGVFDNVMANVESIDAAMALVEEKFPGARWLRKATG
jgi:hypothetical protein